MMDKLKSIFSNILMFEGTSMQPNILLMSKLLVALLWYHGFYFKINEPFIPFLPFLDSFNYLIPGVFKITLKSLFLILSFFIFLNIKVRASSLMLGCIVILNILASKPIYSNHTLICGCALFLAGLTDKNQSTRLLILQLSVMYFGASLNKILDIDWWSGVYMDNWLIDVRYNFIYLKISELMPELWFAKILSWGAFSTELFICIALLNSKLRDYAVWIIIIFHLSIFTLTHLRFGHFLESILILTIALIKWPKSKILVGVQNNKLKLFKKIVDFLDFDKKIVWEIESIDKEDSIKIKYDNKILYNSYAIKKIFLYTPGFYILAFIIDVVLKTIFYNENKLLFIMNVVFAWCLVFYFSSAKEFLKSVKSRRKLVHKNTEA